MNKKILAILMTVCMVVTMIPVVAFADVPEKVWGDNTNSGSNDTNFTTAEAMVLNTDKTKETYFHDIDTAVEFVNENCGELYVLDPNVVFHQDLVFNNSKQINIFLTKCEGKTITVNKDIKVKENGNISLCGGTYNLNSNPNGTEDYGNTIYVAGLFSTSRGTTINAGTNNAIETTSYIKYASVSLYGILNAKGKAIVGKGSARISVVGARGVPGNWSKTPDLYGLVEAEDDAISLGSSCELSVDTGGRIISQNGIAVNQRGLNSTVTINSGTIIGKENAIKTLAGSLIVRTHDGIWDSKINIKSEGDAIVLYKGGDVFLSHIGPQGNSIKGAYPSPVVESTNGVPIKTYGLLEERFIYSGQYNGDVSDYVAEGCKVTTNNNWWYVEYERGDNYEVEVIGSKFVYLGLPVRPLVRVTNNGELVCPLKYRATYSNNTGPGKGHVEITTSYSSKILAETDFVIEESSIPSLFTSDKTSTLQLAKDSNTLQIKDSATELPQNTLGDTDDETSFIDTIATKIKEAASVIEQKLSSQEVQTQLQNALAKASELWAELLKVINNSEN